MKSLFRFIAVPSVVFAAIGCGGFGAIGCGGRESPEPPVATPSFSASRVRLPLGSPLEITYRFNVAPAAKINGNYRVMVHFVDSDGEMMWTDDHDPPVPTSQWKPGQRVEYSRTLFIPIYPYIGESTVQMGLYSASDNSRLPLGGQDAGQRAVTVGNLTLLPQSENVFLMYGDGWHQPEVQRDNASIEWQWTKKTAAVSFRNPKKNSILFLHAAGRPDLFPEPQQVTINVNGQAVQTIPFDAPRERIFKVPISTAQLGSGDIVQLEVAVDKTFVPEQLPASSGGGPDPRELGIRIYHLYLQPQ